MTPEDIRAGKPEALAELLERQEWAEYEQAAGISLSELEALLCLVTELQAQRAPDAALAMAQERADVVADLRRAIRDTAPEAARAALTGLADRFEHGLHVGAAGREDSNG